jgi:hypothetical protein
MFILVVLLAIAVGAVGFHRGWFQLDCCGGSDKENPTVTLTIDKNKINEDKAKAIDKALDQAQSAAQKLGNATDHRK